MRILRWSRWLIAVAVATTPIARCEAQTPGVSPGLPVARPPVLLDEMDGPQPALVLMEPTPGVGITRQTIEQPEGGVGLAEHVTLTAPPGSSAALALAIPAAPSIPDQRFEAWAWCNRPGMQLAAVVVLPRSKDEAGQSRRLIVRSGQIAEGAAWQRLVLADLPVLLERHARAARARLGVAISTQQAIVSHIVVVAPGGPGATEVWVDQMALFGSLQPGGWRGEGSAAETPSGVDLAAAWIQNEQGVSANAGATRTPRRNPPPMPRIVRWQGEPLELLVRLGFDAAWMGRLPNARELGEAERLGLWIVCPPPPLDVLETHGVGAEYDGILAWDLGVLSDPADVELADQWRRALGRHESVASRPTVLRSLALPREASRIADVMVLGRPTVGSTASWLEHAAWMMHASRLGRAGTTPWAALDTQRSTNALAQLAALDGARASSGVAGYRHLSQATTAALGIWPRGFLFESNSSLAAADAETQMRRLALELTNLRLGMVEPWLAAGKASTAARSSREDLRAMVLTVERSHLVAPMRLGGAVGGGPAGSELTVSGGAFHAPQGEGVTFVLPGTPESCSAYLLTVAGPRQLATRRVTGGLSVTVDTLPDDAFLLLTEDGYALTQVERYLRRHAGRAAQARVKLAALLRQQAASAAARLSPGLLESVGAAKDLATADAALTAIHRTLASQDYAAAFARSEHVERVLDNLNERLFVAMWPDGAAGASPVRGDWAALPTLERVAVLAAGSTAQRMPLAGGGFESLESLLEDGWRRNDGATPGVEATVRLSPDHPHGGPYCLELEARAVDVGSASALAAPPVWITSPPLRVPAGHLVEISGWARVGEAPIGSADPLLVFDSIGGEESAVRISSGASWRPFRLVRAAPPGAECRVTIALGGVGRAAVDSLEYRFVPLPSTGPVARR